MKNWFKFIMNPFEDISSNRLFVIGVLMYILSSVLAYYGGFNFQGLLSIKSGANSNLFISFYNNGIAIVSLSIVVFLFARVRKYRVRFIDVCNVVLISRIIIYFILLMLLDPFFVQAVIKKVELAILDNDFLLNTLSVGDRVALMVFGLLSLACLLYFFYFLIKGLRFVMNSKQSVDIIWILLLFFGLEVAFVLFHVNIN